MRKGYLTITMNAPRALPVLSQHNLYSRLCCFSENSSDQVLASLCLVARSFSGRLLYVPLLESSYNTFTLLHRLAVSILTIFNRDNFIVVGVNWDILASRQAFVGTRDKQLKIGTVPVKPGRLIYTKRQRHALT